MAKVLVTGMSGTGKSTAVQILGEHGHRVVDTDTDEWSHWVTLPDGSSDWVWREDAIIELLSNHQRGSLVSSWPAASPIPEERDLILQHLAVVEPRLRTTATIEIDASAPILQVVQQLEELV